VFNSELGLCFCNNDFCGLFVVLVMTFLCGYLSIMS
jgi:hypothetical protein